MPGRVGQPAASLKALLRLVRYEEVGTSGDLRVRSMLEQEVFLGELPVMTPTGISTSR